MLELAGLHFLRPVWWLALLPLLMLAIILLRARSHNTPWQRVCDAHLLERLLIEQHTEKRWPWYCLCAAWFFTVLALTGPSWSQKPQAVYQSAESVVIVLDVSPSMDTPDITPSRLARAKYKIIDLLQRLNGARVGMIAFTAEAFEVAPLTTDTQTIALLVPALATNMMPVAGAEINAGLQAAFDMLKNANAGSGEIILITDNTPSSTAQTLAKQLHAQGIDLIVLGIGTEQGAPIRNAQGGFVSDASGNVVVSQLNKSALSAFARAADGHYIDFSQDNHDIDAVMNQLNQQHVGKLALAKSATNLWYDEGRWFLIPVIIIALMAFRRGWLTEVMA